MEKTMRFIYYLIFMILINVACFNAAIADIPPKNFCNELQNFLSIESPNYLKKETKYSCFEKNGFYHIYPKNNPKNIKKIPSYTVEDFYRNEDSTKKTILYIIFIKGIK